MSDPTVQDEPNIVRLRNTVASLAHRRPADDPDLVHARRVLATAMLTRHVRQVLAADPTLTLNQRREVANLLMGGVRQ
ncbi:hypothetical protein [Cellulosimicrobium sp. SL-1]|uniref:hypothetical protein n=1 Tax=Cellulosimicrobium sp. SL-1 TaxID=2699423 RepID=UPI0013D8A656|nr:hypothetical protein [Cellulosimicrobium sp. SL-1]